jgi:hypothetical protein
LNNIKDDLRARDNDKISSDRTADRVIQHLALLKQDIDTTSSLKEQLGELKIKGITLEEKCIAKDAEIVSLRDTNRKLCDERDADAEQSRKRDARKAAENEDLRADLARTRSDIAQAHQDTENHRRQLVSEQERLLQAKDNLRIAEESLERLGKETANLRETVSSPVLTSLAHFVEPARSRKLSPAAGRIRADPAGSKGKTRRSSPRSKCQVSIRRE